MAARLNSMCAETRSSGAPPWPVEYIMPRRNSSSPLISGVGSGSSASTSVLIASIIVFFPLAGPLWTGSTHHLRVEESADAVKLKLIATTVQNLFRKDEMNTQIAFKHCEI